MRANLALVAYLTPDYDTAIAFLRDGLGWLLLEDTDLSDEKSGKRWVRMAPSEDTSTQFLIAQAVEDQRAALGQAAGGRVAYFLHTDDFETCANQIRSAGGVFEETPRDEAYGRVAVFRDPFGNRWDLIEPK